MSDTRSTPAPSEVEVVDCAHSSTTTTNCAPLPSGVTRGCHNGRNYVQVGPRDVWQFGRFLPTFDYSRQTVLDSFERVVSENPEAQMLGRRMPLKEDPTKVAPEFTWLTRGQVLSQVNKVGAALAEAGEGLLPRGSSVGILSINRPEWLVTQYACYKRSLVPVPLYVLSGASSSMAYIMANAGIRTVFCSGSTLSGMLDNLDAAPAETTPDIRWIVCYDPLPKDDEARLRGRLEAKGIRLSFFADLVAAEERKYEEIRPTPQDKFLILYTSGTTGNPKGVVVPHLNVCKAIDVILCAPHFMPDGPENLTYYSYMPLAHTFEQEFVHSLIMAGSRTGFFSGQVAMLFEDIAQLRPEIMVSVPRVWKKLQEKVQEAVAQSGWAKRKVFEMAVSHKIESLRTGVPTWINWDKLALHKVADRLGGRMKFILVGGAAFDASLHQWLQAVTNVPVFQGYGLTETFACITAQLPEERAGSVGTPLAGCTMRLADIPEMNYFATSNPPRGEICGLFLFPENFPYSSSLLTLFATVLSGVVVFPEYWKDPELTKTSFEDGFFMSGDVGQLNPDGTVSIIDRKKNIFKLAQGEYVAAEYLETVFTKAAGVSQIWIWGDSFDSFLVAVVVPNITELRDMAKDAGLTIPAGIEDAAFCELEEVVYLVVQSLAKAGKEKSLQGFEFVKGVVVEPVPWTPESGAQTPSFKLIRSVLKDRYLARLTALREHVRSSL